MRDAVFTGRDVEEAVAEASRALGLSQKGLRYLVLEAGGPGVRGGGDTPARIAVLLDAGPPASSERAAAGVRGEADPRESIRRVVAAVAEAAGVSLDAQFGAEEKERLLHVRLSGSGLPILFDDGGEVLRALEHLLQRMHGAEARPLLDCEGYREQRDEALREKARSLAAEVRRDGTARTTEPLNAYERRIVHIAVSEQAGLRSFSVGEGAERRVTVAPDPTGAGGAERG